MSTPLRQLAQGDVPIGQPLAFALADGAGRLLLKAGTVVPDADDVRLLFHHGPVVAVEPASVDALTSAPAADPSARPRLGSMGLAVGTILQVQEKSAPLRAPLSCRLIGYIEGEALFVTLPADARRTLRPEPREALLLRGFSGRAVYSMLCSVTAVCQFPSPYLVLSMPSKLQKMPLRKAKRVQVRIGAMVRLEAQPAGVSDRLGVIRDICLDGALVQSAGPVFRPGDRLCLAFTTHVDGHQEDFSLAGRVASGPPALGAPSSAFPSFGVEFSLSKEQSAQLSRLIIERLDS
ncbi:flagellar brake protein [Ralstonia solanacearum]|uniref:Type IV pilus assembly PilZ n=1 Tax=Ralstonia solanacearum CFBP2957 TaxID=859656 RepID=D8P6E2_RALSL|nr:flagellar brake protein [Ralstonia solanacearum]MBB6592776.1 flagellar brake protein [Ralstonia solanacearum]MBB6596998.1 flagellar brake protein [Ralstonia solanacearum]MDB0507798.1 flagellar brake protein [Ralstonia solanacearum]MDB0512068.1 flagellar brake protein [Ralstonia solanacearum]MDB0526755.1 flagellar brake protein [Ralstonia solanacearum]